MMLTKLMWNRLLVVLLCTSLLSAPLHAADSDANEESSSAATPVSTNWNRHAPTLHEMLGVDLFDKEDDIQKAKNRIRKGISDAAELALLESVWGLLKEGEFKRLYYAFITAIGPEKLGPGSGELHCRLMTSFYENNKNPDLRVNWTIEDQLNLLADFIKDTPEYFAVYNPHVIEKIRLKAKTLSSSPSYFQQLRKMGGAAGAVFMLGCAATIYVAGFSHGYFSRPGAPEDRIIEKQDPLPPYTDVRDPSEIRSLEQRAREGAKDFGREIEKDLQ